MKKLIIFFFLNCIIHSSYSQNVLNKIFELRLGMTERELKEVVDTALLEEDKDLKFASVIERGNNKISSYHLKEYSPSYDYVLKDIKLFFYEGKLYTIRIDSYNFKTEYLLTKKYGKPDITEGSWVI